MNRVLPKAYSIFEFMACELCGTQQEVKTYVAREMMFGTREQFTYFECSGCGILRISDIPADLGQYYPHTYNPHAAASNHAIKARVRQSLVSCAIKSRLFLNAATPFHRFTTAELAHALRLKPEMRILDVGCGAGLLVKDLRAAGFTAMGIDRFAPGNSDAQGVVIRQCELQAVSEQFDCVLFNHSIEHIADQVGTLQLVLSKLRTGGTCIVRIPLASWAWKEYGVDWVQLDAPRHLCVHSEKSFRLAAEKSGFAVSDIVYDSFDFMFWGSELYRLDVPLEDGRPHLSDYFSKDRMNEFCRRAAELNQQHEGDQATFFLHRI